MMPRLFRNRGRAAWMALIGLLLAIGPSPALAHTTLLRSEPPNNAVLSEPPREVRLWFSEPVSPTLGEVEVLDVDGRRLETGGFRALPGERSALLLPLPDLAPGVYSVTWGVFSEVDGHAARGTLVFGVGAAADLASAAVVAPVEEMAPVEVLLRWFHFGALAALTGALGVVYLVLRPSRPSPVLAAARRRALGWAVWSGGLALAAGFGLLAWQLYALFCGISTVAPSLNTVWLLVGRTYWGRLWLARQGILLVLTGLVILLYRGPPGHARRDRSSGPGGLGVAPAAVGLLLPALLVVQALGGHAAALESRATLAVAASALHLLAAGLWLGGMLALIVAMLPLVLRARADFAALARAGWGSFSLVAVLSVATLAATGLYSAGRQVASLDALITTLYGRALLGKAALVLAMGAAGLLNALLLHPRLAAPLARALRRPAGWTPLPLRRLPALLLLEASVGLLVLLATGAITALPPARGPHFAPAAEEAPSALSQRVDDLLVALETQPNRPGQNIFTVRVASTRRPPPAEIVRVILRFASLDQDLEDIQADAEAIAPGRYRVGGSYLSLPGRWRVDVVVRRGGMEDSVASFDWRVAAPAPSRPVVISDRPLEPLLTRAAVAVALLPAGVVAGFGLARRRALRAAGNRLFVSRRHSLPQKD